jgi:hypothetical protein
VLVTESKFFRAFSECAEILRTTFLNKNVVIQGNLLNILPKFQRDRVRMDRASSHANAWAPGIGLGRDKVKVSQGILEGCEALRQCKKLKASYQTLSQNCFGFVRREYSCRL